MNYQEYMQTNFVKSMTESLSPIIGKGMARWFFVKIYQELQAQGKDIEKAVNTMTYRAENGLIADMLFCSIGTAPFDGEDKLYWTLMERILEANFSDKQLVKELDSIRKQQDVNGKQYMDARSKGQNTSEIEKEGEGLANKERAVIQARISVNEINESQFKVGDNVIVTRKDGKEYTGKVEKLNPLKLRTSPSDTMVIPNAYIKDIVFL